LTTKNEWIDELMAKMTAKDTITTMNHIPMTVVLSFTNEGAHFIAIAKISVGMQLINPQRTSVNLFGGLGLYNRLAQMLNQREA
jgi:hypothetical protein